MNQVPHYKYIEGSIIVLPTIWEQPQEHLKMKVLKYIHQILLSKKTGHL